MITFVKGIVLYLHITCSLIFTMQAELQKMRVEMAGMRRDAEHYSRQVKYLLLSC